MIKLSVCLETVFTLLLEPLNSLVDHGGYFLDLHTALFSNKPLHNKPSSNPQ